MNDYCMISEKLPPLKRLIVLCEMVLCETKRNEMKSVLCEMKSVLCEMKICTLRNEICTLLKICTLRNEICTLRNEICTLRNENLYFAK